MSHPTGPSSSFGKPPRPVQTKPPTPAEKPIDLETLRLAERLSKLREVEALSIDHPFFASIPEETKQKHRSYVDDRHRDFKKKNQSPMEHELHVIANAFEYVISERINKSGWLGEDVKAQLTTERDDFYRGVDMYVERHGEPIGFSFDITFTSNQKDLRDKFINIKDHLLDRGRMAQLDYYVPLDEKRREEAETSDGYPIALPKLIIGVTRAQALDVIRKYGTGEDMQPDKITGLIVLYQIKIQLEHFMKYSEKIGNGRSPWALKAVPTYQRALEDIKGAWANKLAEFKLDEAKVLVFVTADPFTRNLRNLLDETIPLYN